MAAIALPYPSQVFLTLVGLPLRTATALSGGKTAFHALADRHPRRCPSLTLRRAVRHVPEAISRRHPNPGRDILSQVLTGDDPS